MAKTIQQSATIKAKPGKVFALYADAKLHTAVTKKKATVAKKEGGRVTSYDGKNSGKLLRVVKNKMIVQTWRAKDWAKGDADSVVVMSFEEASSGTKVSVVQANVPDKKADAVKKAWNSSYFDPWKAHFEAAAKPKAKPAKKKAPAKKKPVRKAAVRKPAAKKKK